MSKFSPSSTFLRFGAGEPALYASINASFSLAACNLSSELKHRPIIKIPIIYLYIVYKKVYLAKWVKISRNQSHF